jgi:hypothetical protein
MELPKSFILTTVAALGLEGMIQMILKGVTFDLLSAKIKRQSPQSKASLDLPSFELGVALTAIENGQ